MANQIVRPTNRKEFMNKLIVPYDPKLTNPNEIFSEPAKLGQPEHNRAYQNTVKGDTDKDYHIGIKDLDEAVMYYFEEVLKLSVVQNNARVKLPVLYGNQENWKAVQQDGYLRDKTGKIMAPLLMFKRTTLTQNRTLGYKLDGNQVHNFQYFEAGFNKRNIYSNFAALNSRTPEKKYIVSITPDYVTVEYSCVIWTHFIEQMDNLIESVNFASRSYWGDPNRFLFYSSIDTFQESVNYDSGDDRAVKNEFTITLNGYLIPNSVNKKMANASRAFGVSKVVFGLETADSSEQFTANLAKPKAKNLGAVVASDSQNTVIVQNISNVSNDSLVYINTNKQLTGTVTSAVTVTFNSSWLVAPAGLPATSVDNFTFFCNGQFIEKTAIVSFVEASGNSTLTINSAQLGYSFEATDEIIAIGKFI